jgi:D-beta-D-heptose 7-phosphate kinase/D-beta-D-heptose 1-phosphate adenosyltransferase
MIIGFTNGCFDLFHDGHTHFLEQCSLQCDYLIVGVDGDQRVTELKGPGRPIYTLSDRIASVQVIANAYVDAVVPFYDAVGLLDLIMAIRPNLLFKGDDYLGKNIIGSELMHSWNGRTVLLPRLPGISTTELQRAKSRIS